MIKTRIFVVEDEAVILMDLCERLTALGYQVCGTATHGETTAQKIIELQPDIVLMDVNLAGKMDGVEVAEQVGDGYDVPIIYLTAYSDPRLIARASLTNVYGYLIKPFEERELHATLQVALARFSTERNLREQIASDSLTGLHNRRFLDEMLPVMISRAYRERQALSLSMIDVDNFKQLNDTHGHDAGDQALRYIASALRNALRSSDFACRYGGEEFTLVMPSIDASGAASKMRSICTEIRKTTLRYRDRQLKFTLSAGVAEIPPAKGNSQELLRAADSALYRAKHEGRDRVCVAETNQQSL